MYNVHMHKMKPSDVRRQWFAVLDRVVAGEVVAVERHGHLVVLRREEPSRARARVPDYSGVLKVPNAEEADRWEWTWSPRTGSVRLKSRRR